MAPKKIRILLAKPGLDGHDVGAKVVVRALVDAGFEVIYTGLRQEPQHIAMAALEEGVDVIALSILSGSHLPICQRLKEWLVRFGLQDRLWLVGGNIPPEDRPKLLAIGVNAVFPTGSKLADIVSFIREHTHERAA